MIRKLKSGEYRLYSRKVDPKLSERARPAGDHSHKSVGKPNAFAVLLVFGLQKAKEQKE